MTLAPRLVPLGRQIGAVIHDIDLNSADPEQIAFINQALLEHLVVFFHNQEMNPDSIHRLAKKFGTPTLYPFVEGIDGLPEVVEIIKRPEDTIAFGGVWHSDTAYLETPAMGALLYGVKIPEGLGDTLWANMYAVYESLSDGLKEMLGTLTAVNDADKPAIAETRRGGQRKGLSQEHPVIRTHPETGRQLLYVNRAHTTHFTGWSVEESQPLLDYLFDRIEDPEFSCRFAWQPGSLAFWDNRASQHFPINDYDGHWRRMLRISLAGDRPSQQADL